MLHILSLAAPVAFVDAERYSEVEQALMLTKECNGLHGGCGGGGVEYAEGLWCYQRKNLGSGSLCYTLHLSGTAESVLYIDFFVLSKNVMEWWGLL